MTETDRDGGARDRDLQVAYWPVGRLVPFAGNARTHSEAQVAEIAGSIRAFGFTNPILVSEDGDLIAGHGRLAAARQLGLHQAPVIVLRGLTPVQRRQLVLADNRIALNAGWDQEMLKLELQDPEGARHRPRMPRLHQGRARQSSDTGELRRPRRRRRRA